MSSTVENLAHSFNQLNFSTRHQSWLETTANQRSHGHTLRILSSDDEDSENDEEVGYSSEESEEEIFVRRSMPYGSENKISTPQIDKLKSKLPLPSDDEDEDDEDEEEEDDDDENEAILPRNKMPLIKPETKGTSNGNRPPAVFPSESRNSFQRQQSDGGSSSSNSNNQTPSYFTLNDNFATNDDNEDNEVIGQHLKYPISSNFDAPPKSNAMHQFQQYQQQQQQQQQMALYQYSLQQQQQQQQQLQQQQQQQYNHHFTNQQKHSPPQQPQQPQLRMATMSGMELLIQREQEKAEQKRQKPKMNPGKVKIEGLLGRLPEAGSHNINFQHVQQQHQLQQQQQQQQLQFIPNNLASPTPNSKSYKGKKHRAQVYQNNSLMAAIPQQQQQQQQQMALGYSPSMYDYYTNGRSSVPPPPPTLYQQQQQVQSFYQSPISASNGNLYMMTNTLPYQQNRPGSTLNSSQQYKQHQRFSGNPNEYTI